MRSIPLSIIFTWPTPNYIDPPTRGSSLVVLNSTLMGVLVILVALRYYTRLRINRWFGSDDVLIGLSLLACIGLNVAVTLANTRYGWNRHVWDIPYHNVSTALKLAMVTKVWFAVAATFTRASLLCFYTRLVGSAVTKTLKWVLWIMQFLNAAIGITMVCLSIFLCSPISNYWKFSFVAWNNCMDEGITTLVGGSLMSLMDLLVTIVPIPIVMRLQMPIRQRIGVIVLLSLGFVVTIVGVLRTYYIWDAFMNSYDESWASYPLYLCATIEVDLGVICACVPTLRPMFVKYFGSQSRLNKQVSTTLHSMSSTRPRSERAQSLHSLDRIDSDMTTAVSPSTPLKHSTSTSFSEKLNRDPEVRPWATRSMSGDTIDTRPASKDGGWNGGSEAMRALIARNLESSYAQPRVADMV